MMFTMEFSAEDFKANKGKTLDELLNGGDKKTPKKPVKKDVDEDESDEDADEDVDTSEDESDEDADEDVDADMIKEAISLAIKAGNKIKVEALFKKFKAKTVSGLKEASYAEFYEALKPLGKKKR